jgi:glycosyltransferase involved in cell wall biosynthesis
MKKELPLVSITITSYNRANWIGKAIESALAQDYPNIEIIISDNASTDNSEEIIQSYCHDPRIKYSKNDTNIGMIANFNRAFFELAKGDFITNICSDDYLISNSFVTDAMNLVNKYEKITVITGKSLVKNEFNGGFLEFVDKRVFDNEFRKGTETFLSFADGLGFGWAGCFMDRLKVQSYNIFSLPNATSVDYTANLFLALDGNVGFISNPVYIFRHHGKNLSKNLSLDNLKANIKQIENVFYHAKNKNLIEYEALLTWRYKLLKDTIRSGMIQLTLRDELDKDEALVFFKQKYEAIIASLIKDLKFRLFLKYYSKFKKYIKFLIPILPEKYQTIFG